MAKRKTAPADAQLGYRFTGPLPAKPKRGAAVGLSADKLARLAALSQAGVLDRLLGAKRRGGRRGVDIAQIVKLYAQYGPIIEMLLALYEKHFKKDDKPVVDVGGDELPPGGEDEDEPAAPPPSAERKAARLEAKPYWITRKNQPTKAGGGRYLLSDAAKQRVFSGSDPLQMGDRTAMDVSPIDQHGKKFEGEKPVELEHIVGGVGELQTQEENDHTPVVLTPWEGGVVKPGFQGEITYQAKGGGLTSNTIRLRVRPWA